MSFMQKQAIFTTCYSVDLDDGSFDLVPESVVGKVECAEDLQSFVRGTPVEWDRVTGWFARLSAPGYMDCTEWSGPFPSEEKALAHLEEMYDE